MITQTVVLWTLGAGLTICLFFGSMLFSFTGALMYTLFRGVNMRIEKNEQDLTNIKAGLELKITEGNEKVLHAIRESSESMVHKNDCNGHRTVFDQTIRHSNDDNKKDHMRLESTLRGILDSLEKVLRCLTDIQKEKECDI